MGQRAEEAAGLPLCHVSVTWSQSATVSLVEWRQGSMRHEAIYCSTVQCSAVQWMCCAVQFGAVKCRAVQCRSVKCRAVQCTECGADQFFVVRCIVQCSLL